MTSRDEEITRDFLTLAGLSLLQHKKGYRFSLEPILLADFAMKEGVRGTLLDGGAGCGVLSLILAKLCEDVKKIVAVEIQEGLARLAEKNVSANNQSGKIEIITEDLLNLGPDFRGVFDSFISNPPFRPLSAGKISPSREKAVAKHEYFLSPISLGETIGTLLKPRGTFFLVYPARRFLYLSRKLMECGLKVNVARFVHPHPRSEGELVLIKGMRGRQKETRFLTPLNLYGKGGDSSREIQEIFREKGRK